MICGIEKDAMVIPWTFSGICVCQHMQSIARALEMTMAMMVLGSMQRTIAKVQRACWPGRIGYYVRPQGTIRNGTKCACYCLNVNNEMGNKMKTPFNTITPALRATMKKMSDHQITELCQVMLCGDHCVNDATATYVAAHEEAMTRPAVKYLIDNDLM
jgi:hypothetical protein